MDAGGTAVAVDCDVTRAEDVAAAVGEAVSAFGRLDVMFNNAGIASPRRGMLLEDHTVEDFDHLVAVNTRGVFLGCRQAVLQFRSQGDGGVIVNTGSIAGMVGLGERGLRRDQGRGDPIHPGAGGGNRRLRHPRANCICPGGMLTNFGRPESEAFQELPEEAAVSASAMHPLGKLITPGRLRGGGALPRVGHVGERHRHRVAGRRRVSRTLNARAARGEMRSQKGGMQVSS